MEEICRICTKSELEYISINDNDCDDIKFVEKLRLLFTDLILDEKHKYSLLICCGCCTKLKSAYEFKLQCIDSYNFWKRQSDLQREKTTALGQEKTLESDEEQPENLSCNIMDFVKAEIGSSDSEENEEGNKNSSREDSSDGQLGNSAGGQVENFANSQTENSAKGQVDKNFSNGSQPGNFVKVSQPKGSRSSQEVSSGNCSRVYMTRSHNCVRVEEVNVKMEYSSLEDESVDASEFCAVNLDETEPAEDLLVPVNLQVVQIDLSDGILPLNVISDGNSAAAAKETGESEQGRKRVEDGDGAKRPYKKAERNSESLFASVIDPSSYIINAKEKVFLCKICNKRLANRNSLRKHMLTHSRVKPYVCSVCNKSVSSADSLRGHMLTHANSPKNFPCPKCPKRFHTIKRLNQHMKFHSGKRPHVCHLCGKEFVLISGLKTHMLKHSDEKRFQCEICEKSFKAPASLKLHVDKHTNRKFPCDICKTVYPNYDAYYWHKKRAHGEKKVKCQICDRSFYMKRQLTSHMKFHTNENSVSCEVCNKQFATKQGLKRHMRTHTGERPYKCQVCDKFFAHSDNLRVHMRIHGGEPKYKFWCRICSKGFILEFHCEKHLKTVHGETLK